MPTREQNRIRGKRILETQEDAKPVTDEDVYREDWMNSAQWECAQALAELAGGFHHLSAELKPCNPLGVAINEGGMLCRLATFDFDLLTRAVIIAHDRALRFEVSPGGPGRLRLTFHKRQRAGRMSARHPTLEEAIAAIRPKPPRGSM